jgi:hypothetical protein
VPIKSTPNNPDWLAIICVLFAFFPALLKGLPPNPDFCHLSQTCDFLKEVCQYVVFMRFFSKASRLSQHLLVKNWKKFIEN